MGEDTKSIFTNSDSTMSGISGSLTDGLKITEYQDWLIFVERLAEAVRTGGLRKIPVLKPVWGGTTEEWFLDPETGEVYFYVPPDPPGMPKWEKVDVLKHLEKPDPPPLSVFKIGQMSVMTGYILKMRLQALVSRGLAEELPVPAAVPQTKDRTEKWYKDTVSNVVYRLSEYYGLHDADDIRWEVVPQALLHAKVQ
jgi:hypothetical protein